MENKRVCAFVKILYRFFTKRKNNDEISQYYVKNSHDETISPEIYGLVQDEMKKRKLSKCDHSSTSSFSNKIVCGECEGFCGSKV